MAVQQQQTGYNPYAQSGQQVSPYGQQQNPFGQQQPQAKSFSLPTWLVWLLAVGFIAFIGWLVWFLYFS
jgi:hypothetical protein